MRIGPSGRVGLGKLAGENCLVEAVERHVQRAAPVERGDGDLVGRLLDLVHPEQVAREVHVRTRHPRLELGRRDGPVEARHRDTREIAVVHGERVGSSCGSQLDRPPQHDVVDGRVSDSEVFAALHAHRQPAETVL